MRTFNFIKHLDTIFLCLTLYTGLCQKFGAWFSNYNQRTGEPGEITCSFLVCTWGQMPLQHYAIWQGPCCCCQPLQTIPSPISFTSYSPEGQIKLHPLNVSTEVLFCVVLNQTVWVPSVIVRKTLNSQHLVSKGFHCTFWWGEGEVKKPKQIPNNQRKKHFKKPEASTVCGPDCQISGFNFPLGNQVYMLSLFKLFTVSTGNTR